MLTKNNSSVLSIRILLFLVLFFAAFRVSHAAVETDINRITGSAMVNSATVSAIDNKYAYLAAIFPSSGTLFTDQKGVGRVSLGFDQNSLVYVSTPYTAKVTVQIDYYTDAAPAIPVSFGTQVLIINYDPLTSGLMNQTDRSVFELNSSGNIIRIKATIVSITDLSNTPIAAPANLFLETSTEVERYYTIDLATIPSASDLFLTYNSVANELTVNLNYIPGAEEYDVEWTYANDYDVTGYPLGYSAANALEMDFAHNSTRVTISGNSFGIPLIFEGGYLAVRMRPVGYAYDAASSSWKKVAGRWTSDGVTDNTLGALNTATATAHYLWISSPLPHRLDMNWQYNASYAEQGKKKEVVSYYDGSLRNRQTVTKTSTDKKVLVGETIYDFNGRGSMSILPSPVAGANLPIDYQVAFNRNAAGVAYSRWDFDEDNGTCAAIAPAMSTSYGTANYYSPSNPEQTFQQKLLPDAAGYPFAQVEYTPDNTGRVRRQGGVGPTFQMNSGHETSYFYAQPFQEELDRLFGSEAGYKKHYNKTITFDGNGQASVTYVDQEGRTIATALASDTISKPLMALREGGNGTTSYAYNQLTLTVDLLGKDHPADVDDDQDDNLLNVTGTELVMNTQLPVTATGFYSFSYELDGGKYTDSCLPSDICYTCIYDIEIDILDQCGHRPTWSSGPTLPISQTVGTISTSCADPSVNFTLTPGPLVVSLDPGVYTVVKRLKINQAALAFYLADFIEQSTCVTPFQTFLDSALAHVDIRGCDALCPECEDEYKSPCDASYQMMLSDVSPYGQYAEYKDNYNNVNPGAFPVSVLNVNNYLPKYEANWKKPYHETNSIPQFYYEADGTTLSYIQLTGPPSNYQPPVDVSAVIMVGTTPYIMPQDLLYVEDFVANWKPSWALSLVKYHPEYCYYEWCKGNGERLNSTTISSDHYDSLLLVTTTQAAALANGLINPLDNATGTPNQAGCIDPYFITGALGDADYAAMAARLYDYDGAGNSIWKIAKVMTTCGNWFYATQATIDACVGTVTGGDQSLYITGNDEWINFRMMYFSLKQQYQQDRNDAAAMACDGYNGCIGDRHFNPGASGMLSNPFSSSPYMDNYNSSPSSIETNARQPCCNLTRWMYVTKVKRFPNADDVNLLAPSASTVNNNYFALSGQCPVALELQTFLTKLAATDQLLSGGMSLQNVNEFTPALYDDVVTGNVNTVVGYDAGYVLKTLSMHFTGINVGCTSPTLIFNPASTFTWSDYLTTFNIVSFSNLMPSGSGAFTVIAAIDDDLSSSTNPLVYEVMTGSAGCFTLTCTLPTTDCTPNTLAIELVNLLNLLANNSTDLANTTTGVNLSASPYDAYFNTTTIASYLPCGSDYYWKSNRIYCGSSFTGTSLYVVFGSTLTGTITSFSNPVPSTGNSLTLTVNTTTGSYPVTMWFTIDDYEGELEYLELSDCGLPVPLQCQGGVYQRRADLEGLLNERAATNTLVTVSSIPLNPEPVFTQLLQPYGIGTYTWNNITSPTNSQWITISDGTQLCTLKLAFANTPAGGHAFNNILSFGQLVADEANMVNGEAFDFTITAFYTSGNEVINGTSCYPIRNCPVCTLAASSTYENFDLAATAAGTGLTLSTACPVPAGEYLFTNNEAVRCTTETVMGRDHNNQATGNYMFAHVAASTTATLWSKIMTPVAYTPYTFTAWYMDASIPGNAGGSIATMELWIDGVQVKTQVVAESPGIWQRISAQWNGISSASPCTLTVKVTTNSYSDWQLGLDDISFYTPGCDPISIPPVSPTYPYTNPCETNLNDIANLNAHHEYEQYLKVISAQFTADYIKHCMSSAVEVFDARFAETEYQYTLYYYDQAGNLVRTVPPQGVNPIVLTNDDNTNGTLNGQEIKNDREARLSNPGASKNYFTNHGMATTYTYNSLNQLITQKTPDGGTTHFWYDRLGRIVASQNAKQAARPSVEAWSYTVYDALGRISEVGELYTNTTLIGMSTATLYSTLNASNYPDNWANAASTTARADVTKTFYDEEQSSFGVAARFSEGAQKNLRKRVATAAVYDTYDGTLTAYTSASHYTYDIHGNVQELIQEIPQLGHMDDAASGNYQRYKQVRYTYDLVSGNVNTVLYQNGQADCFYHKYEYDADNRITAAYTSYDYRTWDRDAKYFYYKHGPLARTETGDAKVQGTDYAYTLQGWIKGVNSNSLNTAQDMGLDANTDVTLSLINKYVAPDEMGYSLSYFSGDYTSIGTNPAIASTTGSGLDAASPNLYNGNIRHMVTSIRQFTIGGVSAHATAYRYDQLNRIRSSEHYTNYDPTSNSWNSGGSGNADYKENFTYDHNGNIIRQKRNGLTTPTTAMDDLHYFYYTKALTPTTYDPESGTPTDATNKLAYVTDGVSSSNYGDDIDNQSANNYTYDKIGQLTGDVQEEIGAIEWTVYGKIRSVTRSAGSTKADLEFQYDAMGNRLLKITKPRTGGSPSNQEDWTYTYYVRDASGNVMSTYERTFTAPTSTYSDNLKLKEQNLYGSSRIGIRTPDLLLLTKNYTFTGHSGNLLAGTFTTQTTTATPTVSFIHMIGQKAYELVNHLGNVLVSVSDARMPVNTSTVVTGYAAMVMSANDYSAFGAPMVGRQYQSVNYRYGFNGQEKDDEVTGNSGATYTAMFWEYDARLGRRWNRDPVVKQWESAYATFNNSPINISDINGDTGDDKDAPNDAPQEDIGDAGPNVGAPLPPGNGQPGTVGTFPSNAKSVIAGIPAARVQASAGNVDVYGNPTPFEETDYAGGTKTSFYWAPISNGSTDGYFYSVQSVLSDPNFVTTGIPTSPQTQPNPLMAPPQNGVVAGPGGVAIIPGAPGAPQVGGQSSNPVPLNAANGAINGAANVPLRQNQINGINLANPAPAINNNFQVNVMFNPAATPAFTAGVLGAFNAPGTGLNAVNSGFIPAGAPAPAWMPAGQQLNFATVITFTQTLPMVWVMH